MPTLRDTYRQALTVFLADADRLGSTPDDIAARAVVLAELRHAIAAGLGEEAPVEQQKPATADAPTLPPALRAEAGWIPWGGGECPCRDWPEVDYVCRSGYRGTRRPAGLTWIHRYDIDNDDIIAYRRPR